MNTYFSPNRPSLLMAGVVLTLAGIAHGGSFSTDFSTPPSGATVYGSAFVDTTGGAGDNGGVLKLTTATPSQIGSFVIDDLDPSARIGSFLTTFKLRMGGGTTTPADGISFNFATDLANGPFDEGGSGSGLTVTFDAYDNGIGDNPEGPEVRINYKGVLIANCKLSNQLQTGSDFVPVELSYTPAGTITLVYNHVVLFTNLFVFGPMGSGARFGFGARTGGLDQDQFIDDLAITTAPVDGFYVKGDASTSPSVNIPPTSTFLVALNDSSQTVDPNSVSMIYNGVPVTPTVTKPGGVTTISYAPGMLLSNSVSHIAVTFSLSGVPTTLQYEYSVAAGPLWSLAPGSRPYISTDVSSTPFQRSIALSPLTNHLYIISRTSATAGITVNVLDSNTGADLYRLTTNNIFTNGSIALVSMAVAEDGAIYASCVATTNAVTIYRWADDLSATIPTVVFKGGLSPNAPANARWGDTLAARGRGATTELLLDCQNATTNYVVLTATDSSATAFTFKTYTNSYNNSTQIGRSLQFGPTNTYWLKKKSAVTPTSSIAMLPLQWLRFEADQTTSLISSVNQFHAQVGTITVDLSKNLAAGIFFCTNASTTTAPADRLIVWDISNFASPLQVAQYNFPTNHQANANFIGQVVFGTDRIYALEGNNGVIAMPVAPVAIPSLQIALSGGSAVLSWTNTVPGFGLQSTPSLSPTTWNPVGQPVVENGNLNRVTDTLGSGPQFYRLVK